MRLIFSFLLLCSITLAFARVAPLQAGAIQSSSRNVCHYAQQDGSVNPNCQSQLLETAPPFLDSATTNASKTDSTLVSRAYKTVIPDLEASGYEWLSFPAKSFLQYDNVLIDCFAWSDSAQNSLMVFAAFNKHQDENPNRVPLRDILLSFYQYETGSPRRYITNLEHLEYDNVVEKDLKLLVPQIYKLLGRDIKDDQKNQESFTLSYNGAGQNEQEAFNKVLTGCPFAVGASKMLAEYEEFSGRQLASFEFRWLADLQLNFLVHFPVA